MGLGGTTAKTQTGGWRQSLKVFAAALAYMLPLFWLWQKVGFPEALGVHILAHGKAGLLENWWYSYLLLERHRPWDVMTFIYMWAAVAAIFIWLARAILRDRRTANAKGQQK